MQTESSTHRNGQRPSAAERAPEAEQSAAFSAANFAPMPPTISLPKGGGAIRGIGEKFAANPVTGTGSLSVPIPTSPGRSGFGPQLALSYDSGGGNGPFGLGWSLSLPAVTRKTDKGLPTYRDADELDTFILSGGEDLVPVLVEAEGQWEREPLVRTINGVGYRIQAYRPRSEGLFSRIERWTNRDTGQSHWRSITRDNTTTLYGRSAESRISDPADPTRIFSWLICESTDDKGNAIVYRYKSEDSAAIDLRQAYERNRTEESRAVNRYLKRICYGNPTPRQAGEALVLRNDWLFEVVLDYGEHDGDAPAPDDDGDWLGRHDPFSTYRAGFEVRTYRLCQRVLMFHHFPAEPDVGANCLVRSTDLVYRDLRNNPADRRRGHPIASLIATVSQLGYRRQGGGYLKRSLPSLTFEYSAAAVHGELKELAPADLENLPEGLDGTRYQWVDLDGEGLSGVLTQQGGGWFYKRNLSPLTARQENGQTIVDARLGPLERVSHIPSLSSGGAGQQFLDLAGDGRLDLVDLRGPTPGFYERTAAAAADAATPGAGWEPFVPFASLPALRWDDPNLRFVDLTGDGHADVLITENEVFSWYPSLAEAGFDAAESARQARNEEQGPQLVFADGTQSIYLADMSGDGLTDLVRLRNGEVCYWPNLGYGRFGAKVTMDNAPWFDAPDLFDQRRVRLADIDGSGVTDIIYLGRQGVALYLNESGNRWAATVMLPFAEIDNLAEVTAVDLLGNGTSCLVWSSALPGGKRRPLRYVDLLGGNKPHLLVRVVNNLGAETAIGYTSSTKFYLQDKVAGRPWLTRLPFPVHVVERIETVDRLSRNRFVTRYAYHHGYFDGEEREFRGFGLVEQWDTEEFATLSGGGEFPQGSNIDAASHVPPVLTRTWFHTGAFLGRDHLSTQFEREYYREGDESLGETGLSDEQLGAMLLDDTHLPTTVFLHDGTPGGVRLPWKLSPAEEHDACRALKGSILRQEIYGLDGALSTTAEKADRPYSVSERNYTIELLQPQGAGQSARQSANRHAVFLTHPRETIDFYYERLLYEIGDGQRADPRVSHSLTLAVDPFGNVLQSANIGYGRRVLPGNADDPDPLLTAADRAKQRRTLLTYTHNQYTNHVLSDDPLHGEDAYRTPLLYETRTFELLNVEATAAEPGVTNLFRFAELGQRIAEAADGDHNVPYEDVEAAAANEDHAYRRLIEALQVRFRRDDLTALLPLGQLQARALPGEGYKLAFTPGLLAGVYGNRVNNALLENEGRYVRVDGVNWWIPSGRVFFSPGAADSPAAELAYARAHFFLPHRFRDPFAATTTIAYAHDLFVTQTADALGNTTTSAHDYRVLQPALVTDANGNRTAAAFDALGMVVGTAVSGKQGENIGDSLAGFTPDLNEATVLAHLADPLADPQSILQSATSRLVYDVFAYERTQEDEEPQAAVVYTLARETHAADLTGGALTRVQHNLTYSDGFGRVIQKKVQAEAGPLVDGGPNADPRWVGSGWTVFNNKGNPIRQYEPFFDDSHAFRFAHEEGVSRILCYDPLGRVVATLHPNYTWEKVVFDPWRQATWDVHDNVLVADPAADPDVGDFFARLPDDAYLPTWHAQRSGGLGAAEQDAATKAAVHANTPTVMHNDSLGRAVLTITHNRLLSNGSPVEQHHAVRSELDIEGKTLAVSDALNRRVMEYVVRPTLPGGRLTSGYDVSGRLLYQRNMDAGERRTLANARNNAIRAWDSRGQTIRSTYDALQRPADVLVSDGLIAGEPIAGERLVQRTVYGEGQGTAGNHRGRVYRQFDAVGSVTHDAYDFKGNVRQTSRRLLVNYQDEVNWAANPALEAENFSSSTTYDALNRTVTLTTPDNSVIRPSFNEAHLLERVEAHLRGAAAVTLFVADMDYNARGQQTNVVYATADGQNVTTTYSYDPATFRLIRQLSARGADDAILQDLRYTYDPAGNVTRLEDLAQQAVFFRNHRVEPAWEYVYDAIYRLIAATGREHLGQNGGGGLLAPAPAGPGDASHVGLLHRGDRNALGLYAEQYTYDDAGNLAEMTHRGSDPAHPGWTRSYTYDELSLIEAGETNNRLSSTAVGGTTVSYGYAAGLGGEHGSMTAMPHLPELAWDYRDQLREIKLSGGGKAHYAADATGQRVRKVITRPNGTRRSARIYLGGFEIYREYNGAGTAVTLQRETLHVLDHSQRMALVETRTAGNDGSPAQLIRYQFSNHLGSVSLELDRVGEVVGYEEYYPYGSTAYQAVRAGLESNPRRYRYSGQERDEESGLDAHGVRYYAPWLGRWTSADPAGMADGANLYRYARNNPIRLTDKGGKDPNDDVSAGPFRLRVHESGFRLVPNLQLQVNNLLDPSRSVSGSGSVDLQAHVTGRLRLDTGGGEEAGEQGSRGTEEAEGGTLLRAGAAARLQFDTNAGRASLRLGAFGLLGEPGEPPTAVFLARGGFEAPIPSQLPLSGEIVPTLRSSLGQATGEVRFSGGVQAGGFSLLSLSGRVEPSQGALQLRGEVESIANLARLNVTARGEFGASGVDISGSGRLSLLGIPSLRLQARGTVSYAGAYDFTGSARGYIPPLTYGTGSFSLSSERGFSASAHLFGLTYIPPVSTPPDPSPIPPVMREQFGLPDDPTVPSGVGFGYSYFGYSQSRLTSFGIGVLAPTSTNPFRVGATLQVPFSAF